MKDNYEVNKQSHCRTNQQKDLLSSKGANFELLNKDANELSFLRMGLEGGLITALILFVGIACSRTPEKLETRFAANISVADSIDQTGDYSGFSFLVYNRLSVNDPIDTLFYGVTDTTGFVEGTIPFESPGAYPLQISRNGVNLSSMRLLLADDDTIRFSGEFPDLSTTLEIDSRENRAMEVYERVDNSFNRVNLFIQTGQISGEEIPAELQKWVDLYWEVYEDKKGTFASKFALESAITLLEKFDQKQMFEKLNQAFDEEYAYALAVTYGKEYVASSKGFSAAVAYLDSVKNLADGDNIHQTFDRAKVKLHLDSAYVEQARDLLSRYERTYEDEEEYSFWYKNIRFELYELPPGNPIPDFVFVTAVGDTISRTSMLGQAYVLEFTEMASRLYQQQYDESTVVYQLYGPQGLNYFTIPFDESVNTIIAFFEERERFWPIADPPTFDKQQIMDDFNIQYFPTRILVDAQGNLVRKYIGEEFDGMIPGITKTLMNN